MVGYYVFPFLTEVVWNTINFAIACVAAFVLYIVLSNKKLWLGLFYLYEILIKKFIGIVIEMDPFIIAEDYIEDIKTQREILRKKNVEVNGQKEYLYRDPLDFFSPQKAYLYFDKADTLVKFEIKLKESQDNPIQ